MAILRQYLLSPTSLIRDANATTAQPNAKHTGQSVHLCTAGYPLKGTCLRQGPVRGLVRLAEARHCGLRDLGNHQEHSRETNRG